MHKIDIYSIEKEERDEYSKLVDNYYKMIGRYAKIKKYEIFNNSIAKAQKESRKAARSCYTQVYSGKLGRFNICLDEKGKLLNSIEFSDIFTKENEVSFFVGGAYGFEADFLKKCDMVLSLSTLTMSHKIAKVVLYEQVYRGLTIVNNHPYHK